jgi:hypothetical protein
MLLCKDTCYAFVEVAGAHEPHKMCNVGHQDDGDDTNPDKVHVVAGHLCAGCAWCGTAAADRLSVQNVVYTCTSTSTRTCKKNHMCLRNCRRTMMCTWAPWNQRFGTIEFAICAGVAPTTLCGDGSPGSTAVLLLVRSLPLTGGRASTCTPCTVQVLKSSPGPRINNSCWVAAISEQRSTQQGRLSFSSNIIAMLLLSNIMTRVCVCVCVFVGAGVGGGHKEPCRRCHAPEGTITILSG